MAVSLGIKMLVVGDGRFSGGISFAPQQDASDCTFTITEFLWLLRHNTAAAISVDTASRSADTDAGAANFIFSDASLARYGVLWMFAYDGLDDFETSPTAGTKPIGDDERLALYRFMNRGGGIFATGDHSGLGSFMCGNVPRVRSMRKWFSRAVDLPSDCTTGHDFNGHPVSMVNWSGFSGSTNSGLPRLDTLRQNPSDKPGTFDFDNQSDNIPQDLTPIGFHPILQSSSFPGSSYAFPDHMHEGEVVTPGQNPLITISGETFREFPSIPPGTVTPMPRIIAVGTTIGNHGTVVTSHNPTCAFTTDPQTQPPQSYGALCAYDGWPAAVGRIVTDSSFHHCIDLNLIGNPDATASEDRKHAFGPAYQVPVRGGILEGMQEYYVNTVQWLARPRRGIAATNQFGVATQTDVLVVDDDGNIVVGWGDGLSRWNGPIEVPNAVNFMPGGAVKAARRTATPNQTDVYSVDVTGVLKVFSATGSAQWVQTATVGGGFVPGAPIAVSPQFGVSGQTDIFSVDAGGVMRESWAGAGNQWQPPQPLSSPLFFPPGAGVAAANRFGTADQTDIYAVNAFGLYTKSVKSSQPWGDWVAVTKQAFSLLPGCPIAVSQQFGVPGAGQTDVFVVDLEGQLTVYWIGISGGWNGPQTIGPADLFPPGAHLAASAQFGVVPAQTDVFAVDNSGALTVSWVVGAGRWSGPAPISAAGLFQPGTAVAVCQQAGLPNRTTVFAVSKKGQIIAYSVDGAGKWSAPVTV